MKFESIVSELNGYLKCLERLNGPQYFFRARSFEDEASIDSFASQLVDEWGLNSTATYTYGGCREVEYAELALLIEEAIFGGLLSRERLESKNAQDYLTKMVMEDVNEFYGLASTSEDSSGEFHPLIKGPVYKLDITSSA